MASNNRLTWQNVDAPALGSAIYGTRIAGDLFNNAAQAAVDGISGFAKYRTNEADKAVLTRMLDITTPDAADKALQSGFLLGSQAGNVSRELLHNLGRLRSDLVKSDTERRNYDQTIQTDQILKDAAPTVAKAMYLANNGQRGAAAQLIAADPTLSKLHPDALNRMLTSNNALSASADASQQSHAQTALTNANTKSVNQGTESAAYKQDQIKLNDRGRQIANDIMRMFPNNAVLAENLSSILNRLNPGERLAVTEALSKRGIDTGTPLDVSTLPTEVARQILAQEGTDNKGSELFGFDAVYGNGKFRNVPSQRVSQMTMGALYDFAPTAIAATRGQIGHSNPNLGTSAVGGFGINRDTMAQFASKLYGPGWRDKTFSPDIQTELAQAIFEARKGEDLTQTWPSLKKVLKDNPDIAKPGYFKDKSFTDVERILLKGESETERTAAELKAASPARGSFIDYIPKPGDGAERGTAEANLQKAVDWSNRAIVQLDPNNLNNPLAAAAKAGNTAADQIKALHKDVFSGMSESAVTRAFTEVQNATGLPPQTVGAILRANPNGGSLIGDLFNDKMAINKDRVLEVAKAYNSGQLFNNLQTAERIKGIQDQAAVAYDLYKQADDEYVAIYKKLLVSPNRDPSIIAAMRERRDNAAKAFKDKLAELDKLRAVAPDSLKPGADKNNAQVSPPSGSVIPTNPAGDMIGRALTQVTADVDKAAAELHSLAPKEREAKILQFSSAIASQRNVSSDSVNQMLRAALKKGLTTKSGNSSTEDHLDY